MVFPVVMYGCGSWIVKKAECQRSDAFELWYWRRLLRVPWTARRSNQSILKDISPGCSLEGLMLKLKLQYLATSCEELTHWKRLWCWEGLGTGGEEDNREWDGWMASPIRWTLVWVNSRSWWWTGRPGMLQFMGSQRVGHDWATELNWTEWPKIIFIIMSVLLICIPSGFLSERKRTAGIVLPRVSHGPGGDTTLVNSIYHALWDKRGWDLLEQVHVTV